MLRNKQILVKFIKAVYLAAIFVAACLFFSHYLSQGTVDLTQEMERAVLPVIHINIGGYEVNYLYGYENEMETAFMRDALTVAGSDRKIDYCVDTFGTQIGSMYFEVRSTDGLRLVEKTDMVTGMPDESGQIYGSFTIKDLIADGDEYMLIFVLKFSNDRTIRYYTRLVWSEDMHIEDKLKYVYDFSSTTFDRDNSGELSKYLEPNSSGDNSSFMYTDIHSRLKQVTWGNLNIRRISKPRITISELTSATGYFRVEYPVGITVESGEALCNVTEYYRIRYTADRMYLLNWERYCHEIPDETKDIFAEDQIELGFADPATELRESDGGNIFAFAEEGKLISVNLPEQRVIRVFSFHDPDAPLDVRCTHNDHRIHILNVDENGNIVFMVYGYMNRGIHEGRVGAAVYSYDSAVNTYEELAYVDYTRPAPVLMESIDELSYIDRSGKVYFMLERDIYEIDTAEGSMVRVASDLDDDAYTVSDSGQECVWQTDGDVYSSTKLRLMNLSTGLSEDIKAGYGEYIRPLGFMNDDLIYGLAKSRDVVNDVDGSYIFPMYRVIIRNTSGEILKTYEEDGYYVMSCTIMDGLMNMTRTKYDESTGSYIPVGDDQIVSAVETAGLNNQIVTVVTQNLETVIQISMKEVLSDDKIIYLTPKQIAYEGTKELIRDDTDTTGHYYTYGLHGYMGSWLEVSNAVNKAYDMAGIVMNGNGQCIWYKTGRMSKNQIMAITEPEQEPSGDSLAACVDAMLRFEGVTTNSRILLSQGQNVQNILNDYLSEYAVFNLTGCNLDSVLYYVNQDIPVLAMLNDQTSYLITGFNESQIVLFDPTAGELRKVSITDADNLFKTNGYRFITYIK